MRLHLTLKIPGRNGSQSHFVICDHPASCLDDWGDVLNTDDHVMVTEVNTDHSTGDLVPGGQLLLNQRFIAKSTVFVPRRIGR